jgi:hypothetical protein
MNSAVRSPGQLALALVAVTVAVPLQSAEPLAWKFEPGLTNRYQMVQQMNIDMNVPNVGDVSTGMEQKLDMSWTVESVEADGSAVLKQKLDRIRMTMELPGGAGKSEFDSASGMPAEGQAALMAPLLKAMTAEPFTVHMKPSGEVTDVTVPAGLAKELENMPGAGMLGEMATPEGLKKLVQQSSFKLPEKLEDGTTWSTKLEIENPMTGPQIATTTYAYEGPREVDGVQMEAFLPELTITFGEGGQAQVEVQEQKSSGEILFNREAGRLESSNIEQQMSLKIAIQGQEIEQQLKQTVTMKWLPQDAQEEAAPAEEKAETKAEE